MAKKKKYTFSVKEETKEGKASVVTAAGSLLAMLVAVTISFACAGRADVTIGAIGLVGMLLAAYGLKLGLQGLSVRRSKHGFSVAGSIASGIMLLIWLSLFLIGVKL